MFKNDRNTSYLYSFIFHLILAVILFFIKVNNEQKLDDYLLIGFGSGSGFGSPANINKTEDEVLKKEEKKNDQKDELKKVELPKVKNEDAENVVNPIKKIAKDEVDPSKVKPLVKNENEAKGNLQDGSGAGGYGFELDFGGRGKRRIYSYSLPEYPDGVAKEIDVKLRFTILPDGTVGRIFPLIKADARLETAAMNSLRQWRFEPLPANVNQSEQTVVITFPYRLQ
ncbi:MAG: TonB family protein [Melioribacteraceae bacterium]|nr:TonB family protein [Melioribacteraceae bacterium]